MRTLDNNLHSERRSKPAKRSASPAPNNEDGPALIAESRENSRERSRPSLANSSNMDSTAQFARWTENQETAQQSQRVSSNVPLSRPSNSNSNDQSQPRTMSMMRDNNTSSMAQLSQWTEAQVRL